MMTLLRKYQYQIFIGTIVIFLSGIFLGFGGYFFGGQGGPNDAVAEVDGQDIPLHTFMSHYDRALQTIPPGTAIDDATRNQKRDEAVRDLVQAIVFDREAKRYKVSVPDQQVVGSIVSVPAFQGQNGFDPQLYQKALQYQLKTSPAEFEEEQRKNIAFSKLRWLLQSVIRVTDDEAALMWAMQHQGKMAGFEKEKETFRETLWKEKVIFSFNQWFGQIGQKTKVKTHFEVIPGGKR